MKKVLLVIGVFLFVLLAYFVKKGVEFYKGIYKNGNNLTHSIFPQEKTEYNILLLGYGGFNTKGVPHDGTFLTDSMMVAHLDLKKNTVSLISLPRDLWVALPTKSKADFHSKINSVFQIGTQEQKNYPDVDTQKYPEVALVKKAVFEITGLSIDNYVTIDFIGFTKAIDILGGIVVDVQKTFDDYEYPLDGKEKDLCGKDEDFAKIEKFLKPGYSEDEKKDALKDKPELEKFLKDITDEPKDAFPCRYEHLHFDAGRAFMNGETALKYVRSRHSAQDGNDFGRAQRQQQFIKSVKDKVISFGIITKIVPLLEELKTHIKMDITVDELKKLIGEAKDASKYRLISIHMSDQDYLKNSFSEYGGYILIPRAGQDNWGEIHTMIKNGILEISPTPIPTISPTPLKPNK